MSGITWKDSLKTVFEEFAPADNLDSLLVLLGEKEKEDLDSFPDLLSEEGMVAPEGFNTLGEERKKEVILDLWKLAHLDKLSSDERLALYAKVADSYERFFEWEEESIPPGWEDS